MNVRAITFDYFGTLVDVDRGGMAGIEAVLAEAGLRTERPLFELYLDWDIRNVQRYRGGRWRPYRQVAREALRETLEAIEPGVTARLDIDLLNELYLGHLVESAPPHPEVEAILQRLAERFPLMPITNMDSDLWQRSQLVRFFDQVTTAEMARAYKPSESIFRLALDRLAVPAESVLHCSLASWADIDGAKPLGMQVAWINRGAERLSVWQPRPDHEFPTLEGVLALLD
ncbi:MULTISPECIES: HAD family hydrolase [unclassified Variovorax]|jgi:2-haloalkanoic acid dehalogenase type II|uniref:HAD family hydrolase n=1 Tax=Variovorax TaxID=34072 RepID=UPI000AD9186A|nr:MULTISPECIES: HAD family hydrolase [unclassified Variovorax]MCT8180438.1 HAD hydrolase-like protein [Variovorax sp. CY25R-8]QRF62289.1 HAD hydrolase-like protein [Variovorax paradoxus]TAJ60362.1 MAG: hydrolase [Variovorax sp.]